MDILSYFDGGTDQEINIEKIIDAIEITPEKLLTILPFNLLVPNICESERLFLIKHYDGVKKAFSVEKLTDWLASFPLPSCLL